jgi:hypothetical protein
VSHLQDAMTEPKKKGSPFSEAVLSECDLSQEEGDGFSKDDNNSLNPKTPQQLPWY